MNAIEITKVGKVYSGKAGKCMCGCAGNYRVASAHKSWADQNRGYAYDDKHINDNQVKKVVGLINANLDSAEDFGSGVSVDIDGKTCAAYFVS